MKVRVLSESFRRALREFSLRFQRAFVELTESFWRTYFRAAFRELLESLLSESFRRAFLDLSESFQGACFWGSLENFRGNVFVCE